MEIATQQRTTCQRYYTEPFGVFRWRSTHGVGDRSDLIGFGHEKILFLLCCRHTMDGVNCDRELRHHNPHFFVFI